MGVRSPNNDERAVQTDPTLLRYASGTTEKRETSGVVSSKVGPTMLGVVASVCT